MIIDKGYGVPPSNTLQEFYCSSPMREGVLCWYPFTPSASALDLTGGILKGLLENHCALVINSEAAAGHQVDYIVVIDPEDFSVEALKALRTNLNPCGRLLLAYENPFALRFWAGKKSPDTGLAYDTLFGRGNSALPSKAELKTRLCLAGFEGQKWYYPLTDHWFTMEVYSENYLPNEYLNQRFVPYIADDEFLQFDERNLYREVIRGGAFEFMCGAYLVEARVGVEVQPCPVDYAAVTAYREPAKRFATTIRNDGTVYKTPLLPEGLESVRRIHQNHEELARLGLDVVPMRIEGGSLVMPRLAFPTLWDYWVTKLSCGVFDEQEAFRHFDRLRDSIMKASASGKCYWELVPANCFFDEENDRIIFFDQEYYWENASPDIALTRAIKSFDYSVAFRNEPRSKEWIELLKERYGLSGKWNEMVKSAGPETFREVFGREYADFLALSHESAKRVTARVANTGGRTGEQKRSGVNANGIVW